MFVFNPERLVTFQGFFTYKIIYNVHFNINTMCNNRLEYGMKITIPCRPVQTMFGFIAFTDDSTPTEMVSLEVCKYWETDTDANAYKVRLKPYKTEDIVRFGNEKFYSSDLRMMISEGQCTIDK
jgi:hypothetical protein